jgi:hypothetical protein
VIRTRLCNAQRKRSTRSTHLPIEAPSADQRRVQNVSPVRRREHNHTTAAIKPVHFGQHLVQRLLALVVAGLRLSHAADGVDFVDEDHGGRVLARRCKQITNLHSIGNGTLGADLEVDEGDGGAYSSAVAKRSQTRASVSGDSRRPFI